LPWPACPAPGVWEDVVEDHASDGGFHQLVANGGLPLLRHQRSALQAQPNGLMRFDLLVAKRAEDF
jgi:hypothetical protein